MPRIIVTSTASAGKGAVEVRSTDAQTVITVRETAPTEKSGGGQVANEAPAQSQ